MRANDPSAPSAEQLPDIARLVAAYEVEIGCRQCQQITKRPIAFLRSHVQMRCPHCSSLILLRVSEIREEIRHVEKQMRNLHQQLREVLGRQGRDRAQ